MFLVLSLASIFFVPSGAASTVIPLARRRRERSGPIVSFAPQFGASGRVVEVRFSIARFLCDESLRLRGTDTHVCALGFLFSETYNLQLKTDHSRVPHARSVCLGLGFLLPL